LLLFQLTILLPMNQQVSSLNFSFSEMKMDMFHQINDEVACTASPLSVIDATKPLHLTIATTKVDPYTQRLPTSLPPLNVQFMADLAAAFQEAVLKHLLRRLQLAMAHCTNHQARPMALVVSRGVASNQYLPANLKQWMANRYQLQVLCLPPQLCTDNGVMVA
ncbi:glutamated carboxypeptidase, partial [Dimargaris xerosporica]